MSGTDAEDGRPRVVVVRDRFREAMITGIALTIPVLVTVVVAAFAVNLVANAVKPVAGVLQTNVGIGREAPVVMLQALTLLTILLTVFLVGLVAEYRSGDRLERLFDSAISRIPGIGAVYTSFNQMSEMLMSNESQSFQEVYLVEYPTDGSYSLAFVTSETPDFVREATGSDEMVTLFMPMAPNPVMGGFVIHVRDDRVYDVDMTVEEGIQSIVTSGVATSGGRENAALTAD